jgi:hypothetical protein
MTPPRKYFTDEDRVHAVKEQRHKYQHRKFVCESCVCGLLISNKARHLKSRKHLLYNDLHEVKTKILKLKEHDTPLQE